MVNIQFFGSNFRASDIFGSDEIITNVPVTDANPITVKIPVNRTLIGEESKSGTVILLSPMKNPFAEEIPTIEEFCLRPYLTYDNSMEEIIKHDHMIITMIEP